MHQKGWESGILSLGFLGLKNKKAGGKPFAAYEVSEIGQFACPFMFGRVYYWLLRTNLRKITYPIMGLTYCIIPQNYTLIWFSCLT